MVVVVVSNITHPFYTWESLYGTWVVGYPGLLRVVKEGEEGERDDLHGYQHWTRMMCGVVDGMCDVIWGYYGRRLDWLVLIGSCNSRVVLVYYLMGGEFDGTCFIVFFYM